MKKIYILQPAIPKYRVPLFNGLNEKYKIHVFSTKCDFLGVKSTSIDNKFDQTLSHGFRSLHGVFFWHRNLPLLSTYKKDDIVVINGNPRILNYMLLFVLLRVRGIKTIWWGHGWSAGSFGLMASIRIKLMELATAILVYTDKERELLSKPNCYALNNGLDSSEIKECIKKISIERLTKPLEFQLVFVGRITEKANFELLLKSMTKLNKNIHLNVIGSGDKVDFYTSMADELGISDRVHWHGAIFNEMDTAKIMLSSHAFIYAGSVGLSLIHAFNYGLPAIVHSNEIYHMPEFSAFENGINGISFQKDCLVDLVDKVNELSSLDGVTYAAMSKKAFDTVENSYNINDMVLRFSTMIEELKL
ncbi:glycosyltransferase family 4 protein [Vibrio sp. A1-1]|uniref:glycosyltransferase family 4 protein n=1 Tax=Vibrio sp. A1-1 TaxID=2912250 RepID=UPI001F4604E4|nr:glycosyltransferase family 4 protein [Vibrio sp. A1-1]MCF7455156.1 glycosyltransferase family 4 protein [Vibrio sp. A1-1]